MRLFNQDCPRQVQPRGSVFSFRAGTAFHQSGRFAGLITAQPFADGVAGTAEFAGGGLDVVGAGAGDAFLM